MTANLQMKYGMITRDLVYTTYKPINVLFLFFFVSFFVVVLSDNDANVLDTRLVSFNTLAGCVYCPSGACTCEASQ